MTRVLGQLNQTFWGSVRPSLDLPTWATVPAGCLAVGVVVAALVLSRHRWLLLLTALYPALVTCLFVVNASRIYWNTGQLAGVQGRYLYSGITVLALALALVWLEIRRRTGRGVGTTLAATVAGATVLVVPLGYLFAFRVHWGAAPGGVEGSYRAMVAATALQPWEHLSVVVLTGALVLAAAATVLGTAARDDARPDDDRRPGEDETAVAAG